MIRRIRACSKVRGEISPPGDKSISHRGVILNSIARGRAKVRGASSGADLAATISCLRSLGVKIQAQNGVLDIWGGERLQEADDVLQAQNSATTARMLCGLLASQPFVSIITGDRSLRQRPMGRVMRPLRLMGAELWGRKNDLLPVVIRGARLRGIEYTLPEPSAQVKSAIILASLAASGETKIKETIPCRDHTEKMLELMEADIKREGDVVIIKPKGGGLRPVSIDVPGDISAASFWLVLGTIHPDAQIRIVNCGVNPTRMGIVNVLKDMGAKVEIENRRLWGNEPVADLYVESSHLHGIEVDPQAVPGVIDEVPLILLAGSLAQGRTVIRGASELRLKEVDRIRKTVMELSRFEIEARELPDGAMIYGGAKLQGAECQSHGDHRLAMLLGVAGMVAQGETAVHGAEAASISYPKFWDDASSVCQYA
mgnify:CR=1 FL=1